jgi:CubicO group peptidase (beta-lactamase class C family)
MAKSYVFALIGVAVEEGRLASIADPMTKYAPELAGSAYDGVAIKDVLQMSSGARWSEDYANPRSDVMRFARIFALGGSLDQFVASVPREYTPGTLLRYNSADTQALGLVLVKATGRDLADYMHEKLWDPLGAEREAHWLLDSKGRAMTAGGLTATARDFARIGELYRLGGAWNGRQLVPEAWVHASTRADAPRLGPKPDALGYGYQWWLPEGGARDLQSDDLCRPEAAHHHR